MTKELQSIPLAEFSSNLTNFVEKVIRESKPIMVENDKGERAVVKPLSPRKIKPGLKTEAGRQAFLAVFGSWKDLDVDQFLKDNYESRGRSIQTSVEL